MGEFVKFLPGALDRTLSVIRQLFYLPPLALVVTVALLVGARRLRLGWPLRGLLLLLAVPVSLQLLPPAWSPASLMTPEFRLQTIALGVCWLFLAGYWLLARIPLRLGGALSAGLALAGTLLPAWQMLVVKPAVNKVYGSPPSLGWGFFLCMAGLAVLVASGVILALRGRSSSPWSTE
jgi:hypothetical protein